MHILCAHTHIKYDIYLRLEPEVGSEVELRNCGTADKNRTEEVYGQFSEKSRPGQPDSEDCGRLAN